MATGLEQEFLAPSSEQEFLALSSERLGAGVFGSKLGAGVFGSELGAGAFGSKLGAPRSRRFWLRARSGSEQEFLAWTSNAPENDSVAFHPGILIST